MKAQDAGKMAARQVHIAHPDLRRPPAPIGPGPQLVRGIQRHGGELTHATRLHVLTAVRARDVEKSREQRASAERKGDKTDFAGIGLHARGNAVRRERLRGERARHDDEERKGGGHSVPKLEQ
jgi:hypothetical protein